MRVGMPHMGNLYIPFRAMFRGIGLDLITPPANSQRSLSFGTRYSPEGLCLPFKLTLGNMIEAAELGADTMVTAGGYGTCRFGYYARLQKQILLDLGYDVEMIELDLSRNRALNFLKIGRRLSNNGPWLKIILAIRFGVAKMNALDRLEKVVHKVRAVERMKGTANKIFTKAIEAIDNAHDYDTLRKVQKDYIDQLNQIPKDSQAQPLIVGVIGEFYVILEPFSNLDVESELGKLGVEVRRTTFMSKWTRFSFFLNYLGLDEKARIHKAASPYLKRDIGGDGWESVGEKVLHAKEYDGLIHIAPFTCMPETVARNIMSSTKENIPVLTLLCDEQSSKPGMLTRLEAFVDMLERKRRTGNNYQRLASL